MTQAVVIYKMLHIVVVFSPSFLPIVAVILCCVSLCPFTKESQSYTYGIYILINLEIPVQFSYDH